MPGRAVPSLPGAQGFFSAALGENDASGDRAGGLKEAGIAALGQRSLIPPGPARPNGTPPFEGLPGLDRLGDVGADVPSASARAWASRMR